MTCVHSYSSPLNLVTLQRQRQRHNAGKFTKLYWHLFGYSTKKHAKLRSQVGVVPLKVEDFPTCFTLAVAVNKPPDIHVIFQTSALMIFVYMIANFVVPELLAESLGLDKVDEIEQPKPNTYSADQEEASSNTKNSSNSTNPK